MTSDYGGYEGPVGGGWASAPAAPPEAPPLYEPPRIGQTPLRPLLEPDPEPPVPDRQALGARAALIGGIVGAVVAVIITGGLFLVFERDGGDATATTEAQAQSGPAATLESDPLDIRTLIDKAQPSVVSIETDTETIRGIFGGAGSGVVISEDGLILTNAHVISGADTVNVILSDGREFSADLVGSEPDRDIALIQIQDIVGLVPAELGSSASLQVGDDVVAIGNALGLAGTPTVTTGIVSALDRSIDAPPVQLDNLIQTDAAINPGNSGGALVNAAGQVVGIPTAIIDQAQNIGFAISIDSIKPLIDDLASGNATVTLDTAFLGVSSQTIDGLTPDERSEFGIEADSGAFVLSVTAGSAAEVAGLEEGDVILSIDGQAVDSPDDLGAIVMSHEPGDEIEIAYERDGESTTVTTTLTTRGETGD